MASRFVIVVAIFGLANASPTLWKGSLFGNTIEEMRSMCNNQDVMACIKFKAMSFMDNIFQKDSYKLSDNVLINRNSYRSNEIEARSTSLDDKVEEYIKSHDVTFKLPMVDSQVTLDARSLDQDELNLKLSFSGSSVEQARKSKLKKIFIPILVFILLKAMTVIPLVIGVLGLKAWNALQLSFFGFVTSVALAIFQLCKKIATDNVAAPQISGHAGWDGYGHYAARSLDVSEGSQDLVYSAYRK